MHNLDADVGTIRNHMPGLLRALVLPGIAAAVGGVATASSVKTWYPTLEKPSFNPPSSLFGPVWTTLYLMMGFADYLVSQRGEAPHVHRAQTLYRGQLGFNALWSVLFFGRRSPLSGFVEIIVLWVAVAMTLVAFARISRLAALLLAPYLLWTTFAGVLNAAIWWKNR